MVGPLNPEIRHFYVLGSLPWIGYLNKCAGGIVRTQNLESGSIFRCIDILFESLERSLLVGYTTSQEKKT
jgi:hypothetical protein